MAAARVGWLSPVQGAVRCRFGRHIARKMAKTQVADDGAAAAAHPQARGGAPGGAESRGGAESWDAAVSALSGGPARVNQVGLVHTHSSWSGPPSSQPAGYHASPSICTAT